MDESERSGESESVERVNSDDQNVQLRGFPTDFCLRQLFTIQGEIPCICLLSLARSLPLRKPGSNERPPSSLTPPPLEVLAELSGVYLLDIYDWADLFWHVASKVLHIFYAVN